MRKLYRIAVYSLTLATLSMAAVPAQTIAPGDPVAGTVIVDGNDFMQAQHMSNLITSGERLTENNLQTTEQIGNQRYGSMMGGGGAAGGGAPHVDPKLLERKVQQLNTFTASESTVPHDLATKLGAGDAVKTARLQKLFGMLLARYHAVAKDSGDEKKLSAPYSMLLLLGYGVDGTLPADMQGASPDRKSLAKLGDALTDYVAALQLVSGHAASDAEKQRAFDTIAISTTGLAAAYDLAQRRGDAQLTARVKAQADGTITRMFGCSPQTTPLDACVQHVGRGSAKVEVDHGVALLKL